MSSFTDSQKAIAPRRTRPHKVGPADGSKRPPVLAQLPEVDTDDTPSTIRMDTARIDAAHSVKSPVGIDIQPGESKTHGTISTELGSKSLRIDPSPTSRRSTEAPVGIAGSAATRAERPKRISDDVIKNRTAEPKPPRSTSRSSTPQAISAPTARPLTKKATRETSKTVTKSRRSEPVDTSEPWSELLIKIGGALVAGALILVAVKNLRVQPPPIPTASEPVWQLDGAQNGPQNLRNAIQPRMASNGPSMEMPSPAATLPNANQPLQPVFLDPATPTTDNGSNWQPRRNEPNRLDGTNTVPESVMEHMVPTPADQSSYPATEFPNLQQPEEPTVAARLKGTIQEFPR